MICAIIQARMSSSRLPGKVLKSILGKPMLELQIQRVLRACLPDKVIVATSVNSDDDAIEDLCLNMGVDCFRGSLDDVLSRFYQAAKEWKADHVVRLTGDCPLIDPDMLDKTIQYYLKADCDYASNCLERTYPDGLDVEIFSFKALEKAYGEVIMQRDREHVTPFIKRKKNNFKLCSVKNGNDLSFHRWTVDVPDDFDFVLKIYELLYPDNPEFGMNDILELLKEKPQIIRLQDPK